MCKPIDMSATDDSEREDLIAKLKKELEEVQIKYEREKRTLKANIASNKNHRRSCREIEKNKRLELENEAEASGDDDDDDEEFEQGSDCSNDSDPEDEAHDSNTECESEEERDVDDEELSY